MDLKPTENEVRQWLVSTLQHVCHIEYFLDKLNLGHKDPERPHDLVGVGNKFDWRAIKGFALQYRTPKPDFNIYIKPSLDFHRQQYHHRKWNEPNPKDISKPIVGASSDDMLVGAVDAVCSLLENRGYQGGTHDYDSIIEIAKTNPPHKTPWMLKIIPEMRELQRPNLERIASIHNLTNIGLKQKVYLQIAKRASEVIETLKFEHGYLL